MFSVSRGRSEFKFKSTLKNETRLMTTTPDSAPQVGSVVQVQWTISDQRRRFKDNYYRVMYVNECGMLLSPDETAAYEVSLQPDNTKLYDDPRPTMVWLSYDGDTTFLTNVAVALDWYDARAGMPVLDPNSGEYWPIEEFFPAYFQKRLEDSVPLNLMSPDFAQDMLSQMFQGGDVIMIGNCQSDDYLAPYSGLPLQVAALSQRGLLCLPESSFGSYDAVFVPFDGSAPSRKRIQAPTASPT